MWFTLDSLCVRITCFGSQHHFFTLNTDALMQAHDRFKAFTSLTLPIYVARCTQLDFCELLMTSAITDYICMYVYCGNAYSSPNVGICMGNTMSWSALRDSSTHGFVWLALKVNETLGNSNMVHWSTGIHWLQTHSAANKVVEIRTYVHYEVHWPVTWHHCWLNLQGEKIQSQTDSWIIWRLTNCKDNKEQCCL